LVFQTEKRDEQRERGRGGRRYSKGRRVEDFVKSGQRGKVRRAVGWKGHHEREFDERGQGEVLKKRLRSKSRALGPIDSITRPDDEILVAQGGWRYREKNQGER